MTRRHGWWGLAYLEAILRLGDWYGSGHVVDDASAAPLLRSASSRVAGLHAEAPTPIVLHGIDGANPLGFLAAVGTLTVLHAAGESGATLHWERSATWQPVLTSVGFSGPVSTIEDMRQAVARVVANALQGGALTSAAENRRKLAQEQYDAAKKAVKDKLQELKERGLKGKERRAAVEAEIAPLKAHEEQCRVARQVALREAVPRPELAIGKHLDCTITEFREFAAGLLDGLGLEQREPLGFLAAFTSDANLHDSDSKRAKRILASTPFCFISGSGHQYFLDTVRQLIGEVREERVKAALFESWEYRDEKLSMRWDPSEDRRYALMDHDPSDDGTRTVWMANLLAYRGLLLFPSMPRRGHLATTAWTQVDREPVFTWPVWIAPLGPDAIRSLLLLPELAGQEPDHQSLHHRGVAAVYRARRIKVGSGTNYKINFSSAGSV